MMETVRATVSRLFLTFCWHFKSRKIHAIAFSREQFEKLEESKKEVLRGVMAPPGSWVEIRGDDVHIIKKY